ncbi:tRNA (N(6)-L-threonylcarbamoyladenosine(37)-C(2))-methylthiotransferase, partial [Candidatus Woesearchaeota archaeon]|nr:tRNA (N(6)-L-threonylcarbamoyladenosine(37)-C(2))-methylthiotransferase [Candidatus Woesearchaeota archaeon]
FRKTTMTSVCFITQGCSANQADSEQMKGLLKEARFEIVDSVEEGDVIILNSCTVKSPTESSFFTTLENIKKEYPYKIIIIAGCIAQADRQKFKEYSLIGTKQIHNVVQVVEESLNDNVVKMLETGEMPPLNLPKIRKNPIVEIIPINRGCLSACTFCKTKQARGNLQSYPIADIVSVAQKAVNDGVKEIWLTSQDTMCYGFDLGTNLPHLLNELIKIPGKFKIRVGMGNPVHLLKFIDELIPLLNHDKVFKFIHLPAQSGSDTVLKEMRRGNTAEEFLDLVIKLKDQVPHLTLATDLIVGFPTETDDDFWQTLEVVRKTTPDVINISRFWPRPKTPAAKMEQLPIEVMKHRTKVLTDIFHNISTLQNERWLGWEGEIIIDEQGTHENQWIGRNDSYKPVLVEGNFTLGEVVTVAITKTTTFDLRGERPKAAPINDSIISRNN